MTTARKDTLSLAVPAPDDWRLLVQEAIDLLAERKYGNPARSPSHNARLMLQDALAVAPTPPAAEAPGQEPVAVKPLEWRGPNFEDEYFAGAVGGTYTISRCQETGRWLGGAGGYYRSADDAKAATQADYEQRIRSALASAPPTYADAEAKGFARGIEAAAKWLDAKADWSIGLGSRSRSADCDEYARHIRSLASPAPKGDE